MASTTILSVGGVTIAAGAGQTGDLLQKVIDATSVIASSNVNVAGPGETTLPTVPATGGPFELVIPATYTGSLVIPAGYAYVVYAGTGTLTGGDPTTVIVGTNLNYSGGAGTVLGTGSGAVVDSATGAELAFGSVPGSTGTSNYQVTVTGNNDTVKVDAGTSGNVTASGTGSDIIVGSPPGSGDGSGSSGAVAAAATAATGPVTTTVLQPSVAGGPADTLTAASGSNNLVFVFANAEIDAVGTGNATIVAAPAGGGIGPGVVTLNAAGSTGTQEVFDAAGGNIINAGLFTGFVGAFGATDVTTFNSETNGADTIFALGATNYVGGNASSLFFLGGTQAVTVAAATNETVFGGSGGGAYTVGSGAFAFTAGALGGGGADTLTGALGSTSIGYFGAAGENLTINDTSSVAGSTFITFGDKETIDATNSGGHNTFQIFNTSLDTTSATAASFTGDTTLIGSNAGNSLFSVIIDDTAKAAHTITISNWQTSDNLFVGDFSLGENLNAADLAAVTAFDAGGSSSLTLSDGTTISFTDGKPTNILHQ